MIELRIADDWARGAYTVVASSAQAESEWYEFVKKVPEAMKTAYERLATEPLTAYGTRQFPLKGKQNKPFWEYELTGGDRLFYAVDRQRRVVVVSVMKHAASSSSVQKRILARRSEFDSVTIGQLDEATNLFRGLMAKGKQQPRRADP